MGAPADYDIISSARRQQWREPAALTLDERGMICDCSEAGEELFGYSRPELTWQHVTHLLPQLAGVPLIKDGQVNPKLDYLCRCGQLYHVRSRLGNFIPSALSFVNVGQKGRLMLRLIVRPIVPASA